MTADSSAFDPYRPPTLPDTTYEPQPSRRPGWLTSICVISIVLGALGAMNSVVAFGGTLFGQQLQTAISPNTTQGMPEEMKELQEKFQSEVNGVQDRFFFAILAAAALRFAVALALLIGGIQCLGLKESGRVLLVTACAAALVFEIIYTVLQSLMNMEMMTAFNSYIEGVVQTMPRGGAGPPPDVLMTIMRGSFMAGLVIQYIIVLVKMIFYAFALYYLQRQPIRTLFANRTLASKQASHVRL